MEENPILGIGVGTYDSLSGIVILGQWILKELEEVTIKGMFKMNLMSAHRQDQGLLLEDYVTSTIEIPSYKCLAVFTQFGMKGKGMLKPYSVGVFVDANSIRRSALIMDILACYSRTLAVGAKFLVLRSKPLAKMQHLVEKCIDEIPKVLNAKVEGDYGKTVHTWNDQFLASVLTSHWQTQMSTIIESSNEAEAKRLLDFLMLFTLPYQQELSSDKTQQSPVPFLFVQMTERQMATPVEEHLLNMQKPCTWVRLPERQIYQFETFERQKYDEYISLFLDEDNDPKKRLSKLKVQVKSFSSSSTVVTKGLTLVSSSKMPLLVCQQMLTSLVRTAITFIALVDEHLRNAKSSDNTKLTPKNTQERTIEIAKILKFDGKEDIKILQSAAELFDPLIYRKCRTLK